MKSLKFVVLLIVLFVFATNAEAQFLNKLKEKVIEKTTDVIIDKTADKAVEQTGKVMDDVLNPNLDGLFNFGTTAVDLEKLPASYKFDYSYKIKMNTDDGDMNMEYLISKNDSYFGTKVEMAPDMLMIFDAPNNAIIIKSGETIIARGLPEDIGTTDEEMDIYSNYTFTEIPGRTFLGYDCKGYQMEDDENIIKVYIAPNMGVSFANFDANKSMPATMPKEMQEFAKKYEDGLMLYMEMEEKQQRGKNNIVTMECIGFDETNLSVSVR